MPQRGRVSDHINSDLPGGVTGHYFRMCCFVQARKHDLHTAGAVVSQERAVKRYM